MMDQFFRTLSFGVIVFTVFVSAFLLFQVQPLLARYILPWFGGAPAVWTMCILFFQVFLFLGYAYAHVLQKWFLTPWQAAIHVVLLIGALSFLPIAPDSYWRSVEETSPMLTILFLLTTTVGIPYFLLSSTGPLLQLWFARAHSGQSPYPLYAVSNGGSLLALLSYPFVIEPLLPLSLQLNLWSWAFVGFVVLFIAIATYMAFFREKYHDLKLDDRAITSVIKWKDRTLWVLLPAAASFILLTMTNQITQDIAAAPLLWVIPLSLYLLSFILCFANERWYNSIGYSVALIAVLTALFIQMFVIGDLLKFINIVLYCIMLFISCMMCHGELAKLKPTVDTLTSFYLSIAAGGALGGILVGVIAPLVFNSYAEVQVCFAIFFVLIVFANRNDLKPILQKREGATLGGAVCFFFVIASITYNYQKAHDTSTTMTRNFYGVLTRSEIGTGQNAIQKLVHGRVLHGLQYMSEERQDEPTSYFARTTGVGLLMNLPSSVDKHADELRLKRTIGIVGLGVGTLAAYGLPQDSFKFYEINPDVVDYAVHNFHFLSRSKADISIILGDALISMEKEDSHKNDILILDAFSGDAIPVHLLTKEAFTIYFGNLKESGVIAVHISNVYLDLRPVLWAIADEFELQSAYINSPVDIDGEVKTVQWMILTRNETIIESLRQNPYYMPRNKTDPTILWTNDYSNIFKILKFKM